MKNSFLYKVVLLFLFSTSSLFSATIETTKTIYNIGEPIVVTLTGMLGDSDDWVGIYPKGASNEWDNVLAWDWTGGIADGNVSLSSVMAGAYEARVFFKNSFTVEAVVSFEVQTQQEIHTAIATSKTEYEIDEQIEVTVENMLGNHEDWIGIYPKGSSNEWENVVAWDWTGGIKNGTVSLPNIPAGAYEARAFFSNTFQTEAHVEFSVKSANLQPTLYEDAEDELSDQWQKILGNYQPKKQTPGFESDYCVKLTPSWTKKDGYWQNLSEYWLHVNNANQKILDIDIGGCGAKMPHYFIGVRVTTQQGDRSMIWDSFFTHENVSAFRADYGNGSIELCYPSPVELVRGWFGADIDMWNHFRVDIEASLKLLEPDNSIISIKELTFSGGYLDNITLSSDK
jgi:hypothetical protein